MDVWMHDLLGLAFGLIVGISLGLTGGGGSIFGVPLLVYGLNIPVGTSIGLSLAAVGITAGFGAALRLKEKEVDLRAGLVFAVAGMVLAPLGAWIGTKVSPALLLSAFALIMAFIGLRMWRGKVETGTVPGPCTVRPGGRLGPGCYVRLSLAGCAAGLMSGLFGVGGGFIIVKRAGAVFALHQFGDGLRRHLPQQAQGADQQRAGAICTHIEGQRCLVAQGVIDEVSDIASVARACKTMRAAPFFQGFGSRGMALGYHGQNFNGTSDAACGSHGEITKRKPNQSHNSTRKALDKRNKRKRGITALLPVCT